MTIDDQSHSQPGEDGQQVDGLAQANPSPTEIVRRGQEAMARERRAWEDWMAIAGALQVGRADVMRAIHTNQPTGTRYEKAMAEWLIAHSFHVIDKGDRNRLLECQQHRNEIEKWPSQLTDAERFRFNHPNTVLRMWKAKTLLSDSNAPPKKPSAVAKLKESVAQLEEENHRMREEIARGGGDLWSVNDTPQDIARVMLEKLSANEAEKVARAMLKGLTDKACACAHSKRSTKQKFLEVRDA